MENTQRAWDMMSSVSTCMVVSERDGQMHSRPLSSIVEQDEETVYFISIAKSPQIGHIKAGSSLMLNFSNGSNQFLAAHSVAEISDDRALIKRLWNPGAQAFWPEGPETANVTVIIAKPTHAEYWDGPSQLVSAAKMAFALATGTTPNLGDNQTVVLKS